jgi:hypothetical protein
MLLESSVSGKYSSKRFFLPPVQNDVINVWINNIRNYVLLFLPIVLLFLCAFCFNLYCGGFTLFCNVFVCMCGFCNVWVFW